jgi:predicted transcriptional regulator
MTSHSLPARVADFVCEKIHSIEELEVVLLLHRNQAETWTAQRTALALQIAEANAASALRHLADRGVLEHNEHNEHNGPSFRYAPVTAVLAQSLDELVEVYPSARLETVMWISRCAMDRIRTAHVRAFAQAFLLKPPKS